MSKTYEPDNQFLEKLEWQLSSEYRRANRLQSAANKIAIPRKVVAVACIVGVMMTGVAVIKAAELIKDSWRKKIEIARAETEVELKKVHLESTREIAAQAKMRFSNGLIREDEYLVIQTATEHADLDLKKSLLNLDEVKESGEIPLNELYAPLVGGRDYVSERMQLDIKEIELDLELLESHFIRFHQLAEKNLISREEADHIQAEIAARRLMIDKIQKRLELRKHFVAGDISAQEVEIQGRIAVAERKLHQAKSRVEALQKQMIRAKTLAAKGMINQMEVTQMQYTLDAAHAELNLAQRELEVLKKVK